MLIVRLKGGLGNQLFQYAFARSLSLRKKTKVWLDGSLLPLGFRKRYELDTFPVRLKKMPPWAARLILPAHPQKTSSRLQKMMGFDFETISEPGPHYDSSIFKPTGSLIYNGYWQSEKYFKNIRPLLLKELRFNQPPNAVNLRLLRAIHASNSVCVHIRRGDYHSDPAARRIYETFTLNYYHNALAQLRQELKNPRLFIFSDEINWVRQHLKLKAPTVYVNVNQHQRAAADLRLMSYCRHFIIANSTYSWWGAWLSRHPNKIVCAPAKWFNNLPEGDLVPAAWLRIKD